MENVTAEGLVTGTGEEDREQGRVLEISVLTLSGNCHSISAVDSCSVGGLKSKLSSQVQAAPHQQRLLLGDRVLSDTAILAEVLPGDQTCHELLLVVCDDADKADKIMDMITGKARLSSLESKYQEDYDVVQAAVCFDGMQLRDAHGEPRKDRTIIVAAIAKNGFALSYAPAEFRGDRAVVLMGVRSNSFSFTLADSQLQTDVHFSLEAVNANPFVLQYLNTTVRNSPKFQAAMAEADKSKRQPSTRTTPDPLVVPQPSQKQDSSDKQLRAIQENGESDRSCRWSAWSRIGRLASGCKSLHIGRRSVKVKVAEAVPTARTDALPQMLVNVGSCCER